MATKQNYLDMLRIRELAKVCALERFRQIIYRINPFEQSYEAMLHTGSYNTIGFDIFTGADGAQYLSNRFELFSDDTENADKIGIYRFPEHIKFKIS